MAIRELSWLNVAERQPETQRPTAEREGDGEEGRWGGKGDREREREEELISHQPLEAIPDAVDVKWVEACHRPSIKSKQQT